MQTRGDDEAAPRFDKHWSDYWFFEEPLVVVVLLVSMRV